MLASLSARRILLVEDESVIRDLSTEALAGAGSDVDAVGEAQSGWAALQVRPCDLLITDIQIPGLSGADLVLRLRSERMTLPVILASGSIDPEQVAVDSSFQPVSALPKPFTSDQLLAIVAEVLCLTSRAPNVPGIYSRASGESCLHWGLNE
ncbi:MAG: response regulator [Verrucomicrobia bacterium]|nr:response regulator [Verrucomicrobiota bacterium]